jgi:branched-chain amino acid transport system permease protein
MQWFDRKSTNPILLLFLMLFIAMIGCALLGLAVERLAYRPLRSAPKIAVLITAIGVSLFIEYGGKFFFKTSPKPSISQDVNIFSESMKIGGLTLDKSQFMVLGVTLVLMAGLWYFVTRTATGRAMRAVSHDFGAAALMGINVNRVVAITFGIGSALAGAGGMMNATAIGTPLDPFYGLIPGVKAFVAAVLGGIGNIPGAVVGGMIMGIVETLIIWLGYGGYKDAVAFVLLIVILLIKPSGLFGSTMEKV